MVAIERVCGVGGEREKERERTRKGSMRVIYWSLRLWQKTK